MKYMQAVGVLTHVDRAYQASGAYQWAREAVVNALQAGATDIRFGVEWEAVKKFGVYRRTIIDNGVGIPAQQMPAFLNKFGGSGKIIGDITGNYGIGFKTSCLPWNRFGVVVLSVTTHEGVRSVNMMWLGQDVREDGTLDYGAKELLTAYFDECDDGDDLVNDWITSFGACEDATTVLPLDILQENGYDTELGGIDWWSVIPEDILEQGHGTVIVLMGNDGKEHTIKGDPSREQEAETKYGLLRYLNTRFYTLPEHVSVNVTMLGAETKGGAWGDSQHWPKSPESPGRGRQSAIGNRKVIGLKEALTRYAINSKDSGETLYEQITLNSPGILVPVHIGTYLFPDAEKSERTQGGWNIYTSGIWPSLPLIAHIRKCHSEIDLVEAFDARTMSEGKEALHPWVNLDSIRKRLVIIAEPLDTDDMQVFPDQSRRTLLYQNKTKGGTPMPEIEWAMAYKTARPEFINREINAYFSKLSADSPDIDRNAIERLKQYLPYMARFVKDLRFKDRKEILVPGHEVVNNGTYGRKRTRASGSPGRGRGLGNTNNEGQLVKSEGTLRGLIMVKCGETSDKRYPIEMNFDQKDPTGIVDINHPFIQDAWNLCKIRLDEDGVRDGPELESYYSAFKGQVQGHVALALTHIWAYLKGNGFKDKDIVTKAHALSGIVAGIQHLRQAAQGPFGTIKSGRKV